MTIAASSRRAWVTALVILLACGGSLAAEWLVTRDGQRIETRGPWKVKGKTVVFTLPSGTFSSLRLDNVDLDASRAVEKKIEVEAEAAAKAEITKEPAKPILELTDADLPRRRRLPEPEPTEDGETEEELEETKKPEGPSIVVSSWQKVDAAGGGFEIVGAFRNGSTKMASDISLTVLLYDADGVVVDAVAANLTSASLGPDEQGQFSAVFDSARDFQSMKIDVSSFDIERNDG